MVKLKDKKNKKNADYAKEKLENSYVIISDDSGFVKRMAASDALVLGYDFLNKKRKFSAALSIADQLLPRYSKIIDIWLLKLRALVKLERLSEAIEFAVRLHSKAPTNLGVLLAYADLQLLLNDVTKANILLERAASLDGSNPNVLNAIAKCSAQVGDTKKAIYFYKKAFELSKNSRGSNKVFIDNISFDAVLDLGEIDHLDNEMANLVLNKYKASDDSPFRAKLALSLAKHHQKMHDLEREVHFLHEGNRMMRNDIAANGVPWSLDKLSEDVELNKAIFSAPLPDNLATFSSQYTEKPIFILGMPRSGTTLLEQLLTSHSAIGQTGESRGFPLALNRSYSATLSDIGEANYPRKLDIFDHNELDRMARIYLDYQKHYTKKLVFVDKQLSSFKFVGLASILFNNARFIHIARHPLDIFLSCYRGIIPGVASTCSIEQMAYEYIEMKRLLSFWEEILPEKVISVEYAGLVVEPERTMRYVLDFLSLQWEESIMKFNERKNSVRTLSLHQVRKGIYTSSLNKWLPYKKMLDPAIAILQSKGYLDQNCEMV